MSPIVPFCFPQKNTRLFRDGEPRTAAWTFTQLLSSEHLYPRWLVECYLTSTKTIRLIRDEEPRTATSTFTQLLNSDSHSVCLKWRLYIPLGDSLFFFFLFFFFEDVLLVEFMYLDVTRMPGEKNRGRFRFLLLCS